MSTPKHVKAMRDFVDDMKGRPVADVLSFVSEILTDSLGTGWDEKQGAFRPPRAHFILAVGTTEEPGGISTNFTDPSPVFKCEVDDGGNTTQTLLMAILRRPQDYVR